MPAHGKYQKRGRITRYWEARRGKRRIPLVKIQPCPFCHQSRTTVTATELLLTSLNSRIRITRRAREDSGIDHRKYLPLGIAPAPVLLLISVAGISPGIRRPPSPPTARHRWPPWLCSRTLSSPRTLLAAMNLPGSSASASVTASAGTPARRRTGANKLRAAGGAKQYREAGNLQAAVPAAEPAHALGLHARHAQQVLRVGEVGRQLR